MLKIFFKKDLLNWELCCYLCNPKTEQHNELGDKFLVHILEWIGSSVG